MADLYTSSGRPENYAVMRLSLAVSIVLILINCVASEQGKAAASHLYFQPEGRCMGSMEEYQASYNASASEPLAVLDQYTWAKCKMACYMYEKCWGLRLTRNQNGTRSCHLYAKGVLKPARRGFQASIWECLKEDPLCDRVSPDRCPGFWKARLTYTTARNELEEFLQGKNPAGQGQCGVVYLLGLGASGCRMACQNERYCSKLTHRPGVTSSEAETYHTNSTTQNVCKMLDVNRMFPEYAEQNQELMEVPDETPSVEDVKRLLASMPESWINAYPPMTIKWTCCKHWWLTVDTRSQESDQFRRICLNSTNGLFSAHRPDSLAALINNCSGSGYWKATTIKDSVRAVVPAQSLNADGDVVVTNLFQTQNPLDCAEECLMNPCCLRPAYVPRRFICLIFGAADGYPACTAKYKNESEWSIVYELEKLPGNQGPVMSWEFVCCPPTSPERMARKLSNKFTGKSSYHSTCLCGAYPDKKVKVMTEADLFCPARQNLTKKVEKSLTPSIAMVLDPKRQAVEADDPGFEDWNDGENSPQTTRTDNDTLKHHRSSWMPVLTTFYPDLQLWAGPSESLRECSLLNCRVQVNNEIGRGLHVNPFPSGTEGVPFESILVTAKDWSAPVCPNMSPPKPFNSSAQIKMIIIHNFYLPRYRCYTFASCAYRLREVTLYHYSWGWSAIGYNYVIGNDGRIYEGRGSKYIGAHTAGHNGYSLGVAFTGWYPYNAPNAQSVFAFWALVSGLKKNCSLKNQTKIFTRRDLLTSESPGLALHYLIHTMPESLSEDQRINESRCPQDDSDSPSLLMLIIVITTVLSLAFVSGLLAMTWHLSYKIEKLRKKGLTGDILSHTKGCQEWHEVCKRVVQEREIFSILTIVDYCVSGSSKENSIQRSQVNSEVSTSQSDPVFAFPFHQPTASTNGDSSCTPSFYEQTTTIAGTLEQYALAASNETVPEIKLIQPTEFLRRYSDMARICIYFACDPELDNIPELRGPIQLLSLFCRSWRKSLIDPSTLPRLIIDSLDALCKKIFRPDAQLPPVCVKLLANSLDFLVLLHPSSSVKTQDLLSGLLSAQHQVAPVTRTKSLLGLYWLFREFTCYKCETCRSLPPLYPYSADIGSKNHVIRLNLHYILPWFVRHIPERDKSKKLESCIVRKTADSESWMNFADEGTKYAKLIYPVEGRLTTYNDYLASRKSREKRL